MSAQTTSTNPSSQTSDNKKSAPVDPEDAARLQHLRGVLGISDTSRLPASFKKRVEKSYHHHTWQYWFVATLFNFLLALQIGIAATLTAIGNINNETVRIAIVVLGGINTFVAGLIAYLKSRNQPNRSRQFRIDLRRVRDGIDDAEADFLYANLEEETRKQIKELREMYDTARLDAEANYPDSWISTGAGKLAKEAKSDDNQSNRNSTTPAGEQTGQKSADYESETNKKQEFNTDKAGIVEIKSTKDDVISPAPVQRDSAQSPGSNVLKVPPEYHSQ